MGLLFANLASELWHLETLPWKFPDVAWEPSWESCLKTLPGKLSWNIPAIFLGCGRRPQYGKSQFIFPACQWWIDQRKKTPANPAIYRCTFGGVMATIPSTNLLCPTWRQPIHKTESMSMDWFKGNHGFLPSNICKLSHHPIRLFIKTITSEEY